MSIKSKSAKKKTEPKDKRLNIKLSAESRTIINKHVDAASPKTNQASMADHMIKTFNEEHPIKK